MNNDASLRDRATHEPSPDGLGHSVAIPSAVLAAQFLVEAYGSAVESAWARNEAETLRHLTAAKTAAEALTKALGV